MAPPRTPPAADSVAADPAERTFTVKAADASVQLTARDGSEIRIESGGSYSTSDPVIARDLAALDLVVEESGV